MEPEKQNTSPADSKSDVVSVTGESKEKQDVEKRNDQLAYGVREITLTNQEIQKYFINSLPLPVRKLKNIPPEAFLKPIVKTPPNSDVNKSASIGQHPTDSHLEEVQQKLKDEVSIPPLNKIKASTSHSLLELKHGQMVEKQMTTSKLVMSTTETKTKIPDSSGLPSSTEFYEDYTAGDNGLSHEQRFRIHTQRINDKMAYADFNYSKCPRNIRKSAQSKSKYLWSEDEDDDDKTGKVDKPRTKEHGNEEEDVSVIKMTTGTGDRFHDLMVRLKQEFLPITFSLGLGFVLTFALFRGNNK